MNTEACNVPGAPMIIKAKNIRARGCGQCQCNNSVSCSNVDGSCDCAEGYTGTR